MDAGGCNIQFAVNPEDGRIVVIEMNPRVSRSSALASKATGFPIAKIAAKVAIGYTLDEIPNDITRETPTSSSRPGRTMQESRAVREEFPGGCPGAGAQNRGMNPVIALAAAAVSVLGRLAGAPRSPSPHRLAAGGPRRLLRRPALLQPGASTSRGGMVADQLAAGSWVFLFLWLGLVAYVRARRAHPVAALATMDAGWPGRRRGLPGRVRR